MVIMAALTKLYSGSGNSAASAAIVFLIFFFYMFYSLTWTGLSYVYTGEVLSYSMRAHGWAMFMLGCKVVGFFNLYVIPYAMA